MGITYTLPVYSWVWDWSSQFHHLTVTTLNNSAVPCQYGMSGFYIPIDSVGLRHPEAAVVVTGEYGWTLKPGKSQSISMSYSYRGVTSLKEAGFVAAEVWLAFTVMFLREVLVGGVKYLLPVTGDVYPLGIVQVANISF